jgi:hypothetical protein
MLAAQAAIRSSLLTTCISIRTDTCFPHLVPDLLNSVNQPIFNMRPLLRLGSAIQLLNLLSSVVAVPNRPRDTTFAAVEQKTYDYVIVGGGLTGLVVANRLSEDPTSTCPHQLN